MPITSPQEKFMHCAQGPATLGISTSRSVANDANGPCPIFRVRRTSTKPYRYNPQTRVRNARPKEDVK